jgi:hypothetical protein
MVIIYILFNLLLYYFSVGIFKRKLNPISIYSAIWVLVLCAYELKFIYYYDLSFVTWFVIISFQLAYSIGCILGQADINKRRNNIAKYKKYQKINQDIFYNKEVSKKLKKIILFLSAISAIAIIPNFFMIVNNYGVNVIQYTNEIYHDRLLGNRNFELIPYIGTLTHIAVILSGIYINRYGFKTFILIPIILLILNMIPTGGRSDFILGTLYIIFPILMGGRRFNISKKQIFGLFVILVSIATIFTKITISRSAWVTPTPYMSPLMVKLVQINPAIYKIYEYFTVPPGVLNAYLKEPEINFGMNSFSVFISFLNKLGANLEYQRYQDAYYIPIYTNVGTYIREIMQDFSYLGGITVIIIFGFIFGKAFSTLKREGTFLSEIYVTLFSVVFFMSFFVWFYRETVFWVTTIVGIPIGLYLDKYYKKFLSRDPKI